jgi:hypothetical protein
VVTFGQRASSILDKVWGYALQIIPTPLSLMLDLENDKKDQMIKSNMLMGYNSSILIFDNFTLLPNRWNRAYPLKSSNSKLAQDLTIDATAASVIFEPKIKDSIHSALMKQKQWT